MHKLKSFSTVSKVLIFTIYFVLILGSSYTFYKSYTQYMNIGNAVEYQKVFNKIIELEHIEKKYLINNITSRKNEQWTGMILSMVVLMFTLFLLSRRKYLFEYIKFENQNLKRLVEDIDNYPNEDKVIELKNKLKNKNTAETYALMSEIIEELQESSKLADEANKTKSLFLANMSHEIRTPLNGIVGFTKFLTSTDLSEEQSDFIEIIRKSSEDLLTIINDILDISKIENGHIELEEIYFNPMEEFENVIESYAANASKKDIDFSLWIDPSFSSLLLCSDPGKIKQVLINLISNAVKFTESKGSIDVVIERTDLQDDSIAIKFMVKDTGLGISKEQESKVFEAFTQADSSTSRKYGGTGLGLTISAGLVNSLGGALRVESVLGEGSTFHFTLNMPMKEIKRSTRVKAMKMAIYAPLEVQSKDSDHYLEDYLLSFEHLSMMRFKNIEECMNAPFSMFDALYIHYDKINKVELEKIVKHHDSHSNIILVTKLNKRHLIQDITANFSQIIYEPLTFSKVEKSFNALVKYKQNKKLLEEEIESDLTHRRQTNKGVQLFAGKHALIVEDNPINQKMIQHTLKNMGMSTECAENGKVGLRMFMKNHKEYDIVFMDIQMPVMNGIEATRAILAYEQSKALDHTPIVAVTANALKGDREAFMSEGMDEYISKPINLKRFITVLQMFMKESLDNSSLPKVLKRDILLYKETPMEAKNISAILSKLDYSVDVLENFGELKKVMDVNSYKCILLDKMNSEEEHLNIVKQIKKMEIPSLLFVDSTRAIPLSDKEDFTFISEKITDYESIKVKVNQMIDLAKAS